MSSPVPDQSLSLFAPEVTEAARRTRQADFVVYVDIDGVLHHEEVYWHPSEGIYMHPTRAPGRRLFEWVDVLQELLEPYPDVSLVLSSTWCIRPGYAETLKRLPEDLQARFIGGTFHRRIHAESPLHLEHFRALPRGSQVWADVCRRKPRVWIALDDDVEDWPPDALGNLIECDGRLGISSPPVQQALRSALARGHEFLTSPTVQRAPP